MGLPSLNLKSNVNSIKVEVSKNCLVFLQYMLNSLDPEVEREMNDQT